MYLHEDNQAMLRILETGRNPTMRYLSRTHRVAVAWLHEVCQSERIIVGYEESARMCADVFTKMFQDAAKWRDARVLINVLSEEDIKSLQSGAAKYTGDAMVWFGRIIKGVLSGGLALVNLLSLLFVTPLVTWYMLRDWDVMVARVDSWMPRRHLEVIREQARLIDETIAEVTSEYAATSA